VGKKNQERRGRKGARQSSTVTRNRDFGLYKRAKKPGASLVGTRRDGKLGISKKKTYMKREIHRAQRALDSAGSKKERP